MELRAGHRVCFCYYRGSGVHIAEVYDGASKRRVGEFDHPQELQTEDELRKFLVAKVAAQGQGLSVSSPYPLVPCNFKIVATVPA